MKNLLLRVLVLSALLGFSSFASAEVVQDVDLETITQVINSPTKIIVNQKVGEEIIIYKWYKGNKFLEIPGEYGSYRGKVIHSGFEHDRKGKEYKYIIVYFKNKVYSDGGNYFKYVQYLDDVRKVVELNGDWKINPADEGGPVFVMEEGKSSTYINICQPKGGCLDHGFITAAL